MRFYGCPRCEDELVPYPAKRYLLWCGTCRVPINRSVAKLCTREEVNEDSELYVDPVERESA